MHTPTEWKISTAPVPYPAAMSLMEQRVEALLHDEAPEQVWLLEHPPLYTAGTSASEADLRDAARFPVYQTGRGGQYTYHGPGQRVAYVIQNLSWRDKDLRAHIWRLEEWIIRTLAALGVKGERREGRVGIWVAMPDGSESKIAAIGVRVRRWICFHGISINVNPDLSHFTGIVPCGLQNFGVTSLAQLGLKTSMEELDALLQQHYAPLFTANAF